MSMRPKTGEARGVGLQAEVAGISFENCCMNASGAQCTSIEELRELGKSDAGALVTKSMTMLPRQGNEHPRYFHHGLGSINSTGLANPGYQQYCAWIPELKEYGKPIIASIAGFSLQEYVTMAGALSDAGANLLEVNLSCPNISGKPQVGYDCVQTESVLAAVRNETKKPLTVKLPAYFDVVHREETAAIMLKTRVQAVTLVNSLGNALIVDPETEQAVIRPKHGLGGVGGAYIKPVALGNIFSFHELFKGKAQIFGCGGVYSGRDVFEHVLCGADCVQIATAYQEEGPSIFSRIKHELAEILQKKGYHTLNDFRGKLKQPGVV